MVLLIRILIKFISFMCPVKKKMKINDTVFTFGDLEALPTVWSLPKSKIVLKPEANLHKYEVF